MSYNPLRLFPYAPFTEPLPIPGVAPGDGALVSVCINPSWLPYLLGAAEVYRWPDAWQASGSALLDTLGQVQDLYQILSNPQGATMLWRVQDCQIQYSDDCGQNWTTQTRFLPNFSDNCLWRVDIANNLAHPNGITLQGSTGRAFVNDLLRVSGPFFTQVRSDGVEAAAAGGFDIGRIKFHYTGVIPDTYAAQVRHYASDFSGEYEALRIQAVQAPRIGFLGATPSPRTIVTGDRYGNSALAQLLTDLQTFGLIDDQTTDSGLPAGEPGPQGPPGPPGQDGEDCDCDQVPDPVPDDGSGEQLCGSAVYIASRVYAQLDETLNIIDAFNVDGLLGEAIDLLADVIGRGVVRAGVSALSQFIQGAAQQVDTTQARAQLTIALQNDYICWMYCNGLPVDPDLHRSWWANESGAGADVAFIADGLFESIKQATIERAAAIGSGAASTFCASFCEPCNVPVPGDYACDTTQAVNEGENGCFSILNNDGVLEDGQGVKTVFQGRTGQDHFWAVIIHNDETVTMSGVRVLVNVTGYEVNSYLKITKDTCTASVPISQTGQHEIDIPLVCADTTDNLKIELSTGDCGNPGNPNRTDLLAWIMGYTIY